MGVEVPAAVSISGFDDIELAAQFEPSLTTIRVPDRDIGVLAAEYLLARVAGKAPESPPMLDVSIVERNSTGPAPRINTST